jgi:hypothetical protein
MQRRSTISSLIQCVVLKSSGFKSSPRTQGARSKNHFAPTAVGLSLFLVILALAGNCAAQIPLPFQVSNPKHEKWPQEEAVKIYFSACDQAARAVRPEKPPQLHPNFVLVLGTSKDETVRYDDIAEVHLKNWKPESFAEAVVLMAIREVLSRDKVADVVRSVVLSSRSSVSVEELKQHR